MSTDNELNTAEELLDELEERLEDKRRTSKEFVKSSVDDDGELDLTDGETSSIAGEGSAYRETLEMVQSLRAELDEDSSEEESGAEESAEREPLDLTLREVASICGSTNHDDPDMGALDFDGHPREAVNEAFTEIHPAVAGQLVYLIETGLDDGFTAQGASHIDFTTPLRRVAERSE